MTVCLNMIVKNEAHVIKRCLESVLPYIDSFVIADTGSTDGTSRVIGDTIGHLDGLIFSEVWQDFATNRNSVMEASLGRSDWLLMIDADEVFYSAGAPLVLDDNFDSYHCLNKGKGYEFWRRRIVKNNGQYHYVGKMHEVLNQKEFFPKKDANLSGFWFEDHADGARSVSGTKFLSDAIVLEDQLKITPRCTRTVFYLAQAYRCIGAYAKAVDLYANRVWLGGWAEEVYYSLFQVASLTYRQTKDIWGTLDLYLKAVQSRPERLEALVELCEHLRAEKAWHLIYQLGHGKKSTPGDILFVDPAADRKLLEEVAIAAFYMGKRDVSKEHYDRIQKNYVLDPETSARIQKSLSYFD